MSGPKPDEIPCSNSRRFDLRGHEAVDLLLSLRGQIVRPSSRASDVEGWMLEDSDPSCTAQSSLALHWTATGSDIN